MTDASYEGDPEGDGTVYQCTEDDCGALFLKAEARNGHQWIHGGRGGK